MASCRHGSGLETQFTECAGQTIRPGQILAAVLLAQFTRGESALVHKLDVKSQARRPLNERQLNLGGLAANVCDQVTSDSTQQRSFLGPLIKLRYRIRPAVRAYDVGVHVVSVDLGLAVINAGRVDKAGQIGHGRRFIFGPSE